MPDSLRHLVRIGQLIERPVSVKIARAQRHPQSQTRFRVPGFIGNPDQFGHDGPNGVFIAVELEPRIPEAAGALHRDQPALGTLLGGVAAVR